MPSSPDPTVLATTPHPMPATQPPPATRHEVLVVGAGLAGAVCARTLADAGWRVTVLDKSRGVGGRLATRRASWVDAAGHTHPVAFDHGAPGFGSSGPAFAEQVARWQAAGLLQAWQPTLAPQSYQALDTPLLWRPRPDMPALVRHLLQGLDCRLGQTVAALYHGPDGWRWRPAELATAAAQPPSAQTAAGPNPSADATAWAGAAALAGAAGPTRPDGAAAAAPSPGPAPGSPVAHLVLALPPAQLAPLLSPWRDDWARRARQTPMRPCWTLMAVASPADTWPDWQACWPTEGPLAWLARQDGQPEPFGAVNPGATPPRQRPGDSAAGAAPATPPRDAAARARAPAAWVAHATAAFSQQHLEAAPETVLPQLQTALEAQLGQHLHWHHSVLHRWRYATAPRADRLQPTGCWWDSNLRLGVCGDHLGGTGVEGAWRSGLALAHRLIASA